MEQPREAIVISSVSKIARFESEEHYRRYRNLLPKIFGGRINPKRIGCEYDESRGNLGLTQGLDTLCLLLIGNANCQSYATARIGVGDGTAPATHSQTGLQGEHQAYTGMDSGYPAADPPRGVLFQGRFGEDAANFSWQEWVVDNGDDVIPGSGFGNKHLNRKVEYRGTKNGGVWVVQVRISFG